MKDPFAQFIQEEEPRGEDKAAAGKVPAKSGSTKVRKTTSKEKQMLLVEPLGKLSHMGGRYFHAITAFLDDHDLLHVVDSPLVTFAATAMDEWAYANGEILARGPESLISINPNGLEHPSGLAVLREKAEKRFMSYAKELGLGPKSRAALWGDLANMRNAMKSAEDE